MNLKADKASGKLEKYTKKEQLDFSKQIEKLKKDFSKLTEIDKFKNAATYQMKADSALSALINSGDNKLANDSYENWKKLLEVIFNSRATSLEKSIYQRKLNCLNESLF